MGPVHPESLRVHDAGHVASLKKVRRFLFHYLSKVCLKFFERSYTFNTLTSSTFAIEKRIHLSQPSSDTRPKKAQRLKESPEKPRPSQRGVQGLHKTWRKRKKWIKLDLGLRRREKVVWRVVLDKVSICPIDDKSNVSDIRIKAIDRFHLLGEG
ncbi:hypothetical protein PAXRUDRAFT_832522 [Paxillus rubicundulus Ve08.2h10]|uniref:Uncharacterized protein n=1 Tax=Paxillus rubicundulus Ve08.2h10 TaxID=930991 RepID=A0A0D0D1N8_9AGAM|nr:hypothetical protein PAXRUDRAFT_832522 [Paxillus rubicundulus Ve08.2h10]